MKKWKIICLILTLSISCNLFAFGTFESILNVPVGVALSFQSYNFDSQLSKETQEQIRDNIKSDLGFETAVSWQLGYKFNLKNIYSLSILSDIGYSYDFLGYINKVGDKKYFNWFHLHSIALGLLPKLNIKNYSIGIGAGVKLPLKGEFYMSDNKKAYQFQDENNYYASIGYDKLKKDVFKSLVIPYIKLTFDYSLQVHDKLDVNFGLYMGYDFKLGIISDDTYIKHAFSSFNFGVQFGLKFTQKSI